MGIVEAEINAEVGHSIDSYIKYKRSSRAAVAAHLGIKEGYLRDKLKGRRPWYFHEVARAASLLQVPIADLIGGSQNLKLLMGPGFPTGEMEVA